MSLIELIKQHKGFVVCMLLALLFTYGKYMVDVTEIQKLSSTVNAYMWIILGVLFLILDNITELRGDRI